MDKTRCLYMPHSRKFTSVDGIILHPDTAHLYPIKIIPSRRHGDSEERFYRTSWNSIKEEFESAGFAVDSTFVWIDLSKPSTELYGKQIELVPAHETKHVGIEQVNSYLAAMLAEQFRGYSDRLAPCFIHSCILS
jgi:hypothetical protein